MGESPRQSPTLRRVGRCCRTSSENDSLIESSVLWSYRMLGCVSDEGCPVNNFLRGGFTSLFRSQSKQQDFSGPTFIHVTWTHYVYHSVECRALGLRKDVCKQTYQEKNKK